MSAAPRKVGLFGGSFDPPHVAHVALAEAALGQLGLDELRILPTGQAWHKSRALTAAEHRLAMARLAFGHLPGAVVDDRELLRAGATYTIDTLRELAAEQPGAQLVGPGHRHILGRRGVLLSRHTASGCRAAPRARIGP